MIYLEMTTEVSTLRAYDKPDGYEQRLPYIGILTVTHLNDTTVYLHGAVGTIDRETRAKGLQMLRARGVSTVMFERHGKMRTVILEETPNGTP